MASNSKNIKGITIEIGGDTTKLGDALRDVDSKSKSLQNELKEVEKLLKLDPTNTELLAQKQKLLADSVKNSSDRLDTLKSVQEQIKKQFENGEIDEGQYRAFQRELVKTDAELEKVKDESDNAAKGVKDLGDKSEGTSKKMELLKGVASATVSAITTIASVGAAAAASLGAMAVKAGAMADDLNTMSAQTGVSTEQLQKFSYVSDIIDVDLDTMAKALGKTTKAMSEAQGGSTKYSEAFGKLGVSVVDASGNLRDNEDVFYEAIEALGKIENQTEADAIAMELFGKSATELNPLIQGGAETLKQLGDEAEEAGLILSQDALDGANAFNDALDQMKATGTQAFQVVGSAIAKEFTPMMEEANEWTMRTAKSLIEGYNNGGIDGFVDATTTALQEVLVKISEYLPKVAEMGVNIVKSIVEGIKTNAPLLTSVAVETVSTLLSGLMEMLPSILEAGITLVSSLATSIGQALPSLIPEAVNCIITLVDTLISNVDMLVDSAIAIIEGLAEGIVNAIPILIEKAPVIITKLVTALTKNAPKLFTSATSIIGELVVGLIKSIPSLLKAIPEIIGAIVTGLIGGIGSIGEVGVELIKGLWEGIKNMGSWVIDKIKSFGSTIISGFKSVFGINSPSRVMNEQIGRYLSEGVAEGILDNKDVAIDSMDELKNDITKEVDGIALDTAINRTFSDKVITNSSGVQNAPVGQSMGATPLTIILKYKDLTLGQAVLNDLKELTKITGSNPVLSI